MQQCFILKSCKTYFIFKICKPLRIQNYSGTPNVNLYQNMEHSKSMNHIKISAQRLVLNEEMILTPITPLEERQCKMCHKILKM